MTLPDPLPELHIVELKAVAKLDNAAPCCCSHLTDERSWRQEGVFKSFVGYAGFTTLDFPFEVYLAARFFLARDGGAETALRR